MRELRVPLDPVPDHLEESTLWVIDPEAEEVRPFGSASIPPLGSVLVHRWNAIAQIDRVTNLRKRHLPWCPLVIISPALAGDSRVPPSTSIEWGRPGLPPREVVLDAVAKRTLPDASTLAGYVARRLELPDIEPLLAVTFDVSGTQVWRQLVGERRRFYQLFEPFAPFRPSDWATLARLVTLTGAEGREVIALASRAGALAGLESLVGRLLGCEVAEFVKRVGWEWVVEAALRRAGYLEDRAPSSAGDNTTLVRLA